MPSRPLVNASEGPIGVQSGQMLKELDPRWLSAEDRHSDS